MVAWHVQNVYVEGIRKSTLIGMEDTLALGLHSVHHRSLYIRVNWLYWVLSYNKVEAP
jgi:hypothetical protein